LIGFQKKGAKLQKN